MPFTEEIRNSKIKDDQAGEQDADSTERETEVFFAGCHVIWRATVSRSANVSNDTRSRSFALQPSTKIKN
jgi:hypothetical protein